VQICGSIVLIALFRDETADLIAIDADLRGIIVSSASCARFRARMKQRERSRGLADARGCKTQQVHARNAQCPAEEGRYRRAYRETIQRECFHARRLRKLTQIPDKRRITDGNKTVQAV